MKGGCSASEGRATVGTGPPRARTKVIYVDLGARHPIAWLNPGRASVQTQGVFAAARALCEVHAVHFCVFGGTGVPHSYENAYA